MPEVRQDFSQTASSEGKCARVGLGCIESVDFFRLAITCYPGSTQRMPVSTLLIEGSFAELAEELAQYLDTLDEGAGIANSIESELGQIREAESQETGNTSGQKAKDDVLKKIITKATTLNKAPERGKRATLNRYGLIND